MSKGNGYSIMVGRERPIDVQVGYVNKQGQPINSENLTRRITVGKHLLLNPCDVWGRRLIEGNPATNATGEEIHIEANDPKYKGQLEFLKYGDPKGVLIQIRYLKKSNSLDVEYQDNVQKVKVDKERGDDGSVHLELDAGENRFDYKTDALLIQYLKAHSQNDDSISKNPNPSIKSYTFKEITEDNIKTASIENKEKSLDAGYIVKKASEKPEDLKVLLEIMKGREEVSEVDDLSKDKQIYEALLSFALNSPSDFLSLVDNKKKEISDAFELAKSFKALDLTKDGNIGMIIDNKPQLFFSEVAGKGDKMLTWVLENILRSDTFKKAQTFIGATQQLK